MSGVGHGHIITGTRHEDVGAGCAVEVDVTVSADQKVPVTAAEDQIVIIATRAPIGATCLVSRDASDHNAVTGVPEQPVRSEFALHQVGARHAGDDDALQGEHVVVARTAVDAILTLRRATDHVVAITRHNAVVAREREDHVVAGACRPARRRPEYYDRRGRNGPVTGPACSAALLRRPRRCHQNSE